MNPTNLGRQTQKHADKSEYKSKSRYVSFSSEEDQPSVAKHRSSNTSGVNSDQDLPQHALSEKSNTICSLWYTSARIHCMNIQRAQNLQSKSPS